MKTVLLVDDDSACREPVADSLRLSGWTVHEAADGQQGLEMARQIKPDAIVCDLLMPRTNGFQLCYAVRRVAQLRHTKFIVLTGRDYPMDRRSAVEAGADEYLVKPIELARLTATLERVTSNHNGSPAEVVPVKTPSVDNAVRLKFWGVRGSIPTPGPQTVKIGGNTSCVEVRADGQLIIFDAGSGLRPLGLALKKEFGGHAIDATILLTHTHWDHIQGFPFFPPAYEARNRIRVLGYEGARKELQETLAGQMESPYFPIGLDQMPASIVIEELSEMNFKVGSVEVQACHVNHPGVCVGYRLTTSSGTICYIPDHESSPEDVSGASHVPRTMEKKFMEFIHEADVLILDSQYTVEEYGSHVGWGHGCLDEVVRLAKEAKVKRLYLFHHDPGHDDDFIKKMVQHARELALGSDLRVEAAREGEQVVMAVK